MASDRWLGSNFRNERSIVWFFLVQSWQKNVHLRLLCIIAPDWSVSINLESLSEWIYNVFWSWHSWISSIAMPCEKALPFVSLQLPTKNSDWASLSIQSGGRHVRIIHLTKGGEDIFALDFLVSCALCQSCLQLICIFFVGFSCWVLETWLTTQYFPPSKPYSYSM